MKIYIFEAMNNKFFYRIADEILFCVPSSELHLHKIRKFMKRVFKIIPIYIVMKLSKFLF